MSISIYKSHLKDSIQLRRFHRRNFSWNQKPYHKNWNLALTGNCTSYGNGKFANKDNIVLDVLLLDGATVFM